MIRRPGRPAYAFVPEHLRAHLRRAAAAGLLPAVLLPAEAAAQTEVRLVHAVPGAGQGELEALRGGRERPLAAAGFGDVSSRSPARPGPVRLGLTVGNARVATTRARLAPGGRYTVLALARGSQVSLEVLRDGRARRDRARVRVVHAAPEFGSPDLLFDGRRVAEDFAFGTVSPYLAVRPGRHSVAAVRPGTDDTVLEVRGLELAAGTASTAFVLGSRGEPVRPALALDDRVRPARRASPPRRRGRAVHVVRAGESLWSIAHRRTGPRSDDAGVMREVRRLWHLNAERVPSGDPDVIPPGLRLRLA